VDAARGDVASAGRAGRCRRPRSACQRLAR
jgi:hypothetical protein